MGSDKAKVIARRHDSNAYLVQVGDDGVIVDLDSGIRHPPRPLASQLARGYWDLVEATDEFAEILLGGKYANVSDEEAEAD